jgi:hypothetical protein
VKERERESEERERESERERERERERNPRDMSRKDRMTGHEPFVLKLLEYTALSY